MIRALIVFLAILAQGSGSSVGTEADLTDLRVSWAPESPMQGTIVQVRVGPDDSDSTAGPPASVSGELEGEPLHFEASDDGSFYALAGIPIYATDSIRLALRLETEAGTSDQMVRYLPVARGEFSVAQLSVDPRFVNPPDSALAVRIAAERDSVRRVQRRSHMTPRVWIGEFVVPRDTRVTSGFGQRREYNGELRSRHMGLDLAGQEGEPVRAANRGVVALVGGFYYAGNLVYLDHGRGVMTAYLHLSKTLVAVGDTVERGQVIGSVGMTGRVTGPHLHWIAKYGRVTVNPLSLLAVGKEAWSEKSGQEN
jgi:murein DD-endopeptidase MepM/ murein hydrolase activator NlpD